MYGIKRCIGGFYSSMNQSVHTPARMERSFSFVSVIMAGHGVYRLCQSFLLLPMGKQLYFVFNSRMVWLCEVMWSTIEYGSTDFLGCRPRMEARNVTPKIGSSPKSKYSYGRTFSRCFPRNMHCLVCTDKIMSHPAATRRQHWNTF